MGDVSRRNVLTGVAGAAALTAFPVETNEGQASVPSGSMRPVGLTTEHVVDPLGIDAAAPRFGWRLAAAGRDRA